MSEDQIRKDLKTQKNQIITKEDLIRGESLIRLDLPEPWLKRKQAVEAAKRGEYPKTDCPHPVSRAVWMEDFVTESDRIGRPTNWFECEVCHSILFLVDPYGTVASDG